jgi:hypothetical protein
MAGVNMSKNESAAKDAGSKPQTTTTNAASGTEAYARWLEQMQRTRGRHAAITRNLYTWSNYKSWADKVKNSWEPEAGK